MSALVISSCSKGTYSWAPILVYFCCLPDIFALICCITFVRRCVFLSCFLTFSLSLLHCSILPPFCHADKSHKMVDPNKHTYGFMRVIIWEAWAWVWWWQHLATWKFILSSSTSNESRFFKISLLNEVDMRITNVNTYC